MNTKSKLTTAFVVLFLTGVITGVMGMRIVYRNMLAKALERPSILSERVETSLGNLSLSPEQDQKITQILTESREQSQNLREQFRPRIWTILTEARQKIDSELTPEQRSQFRRAVRDDLPLLQRVIERHEAEAQ
jgi:hypothetical protein